MRAHVYTLSALSVDIAAQVNAIAAPLNRRNAKQNNLFADAVGSRVCLLT